MKCYVHQAADAVGVCKHCQRGTCPACAADVGGCVACRGRCEAPVERVNRIIDASRPSMDAYARAGDTMRMVALWLAVVAGASLVGGLMTSSKIDSALFATSALFGLGAVLYGVQARRWRLRP